MITLDGLRTINGLVARRKFLEWDKQRAIRDGKGLFTINSQIRAINEDLFKLGVNLQTAPAEPTAA